jgi:hypothetical protein
MGDEGYGSTLTPWCNAVTDALSPGDGVFMSMRFGVGVVFFGFLLYTQNHARTAAPTRTRKVMTPTAIPIMVPFPTPLSEVALGVELEALESPVDEAEDFDVDDAAALAVIRPFGMITLDDESYLLTTEGVPMSKTRFGLVQQSEPSELQQYFVPLHDIKGSYVSGSLAEQCFGQSLEFHDWSAFNQQMLQMTKED